MSLSLQTEHALLLLSHKTAGTGLVVTAGSVAVERAELLSFLSSPGPEIVNLCAVVGAVFTAVGVIAGIWFRWDSRRREIAASQSRGGFCDE